MCFIFVFLKYSFLSSLAGSSLAAGHLLSHLHATSFIADSTHVCKSSEVIKLSSCQSHKRGSLNSGQSTLLGNISLVFVIFAAMLNFLGEVMNEQQIMNVVRIGQGVEFSLDFNFRKCLIKNPSYFFPTLIVM